MGVLQAKDVRKGNERVATNCQRMHFSDRVG